MPRKGDRSSAVSATRTMRFTIPSDFEFSREIQQQVMAEVQRLGFAESAQFAIKLGLEEAIVNAIKHGNQFDPAKRVFVEAEISPQLARITVEDEGVGFERQSVPNPLCDENLDKCSGRGILLIEAYMSDVQWANRGRRIIMTRTNEPEGPHVTCD